MSAATERELALRVSDLENAMKAIGRIVAATTTTPKARLQQITGVLSMYGCDANGAAALPLTTTQQPTNPKDTEHA